MKLWRGKSRFRRAPDGRMRGAAIMETVVFLTLMFFTFSLFWDLMMGLISRLRHESAAVQIALSFKNPALTATVQNDPNTGSPQVVITKLTANEITDPNTGFLWVLNDTFNKIMDNIGSGASLVEHNIASTLRYLDICQPGNSCTASFKEGGATQATVPGGIQHFVNNGATNICFQNNQQIEVAFASYVNSQLQMIIDGSRLIANNMPGSVGTKMLNTPDPNDPSQFIESYLPYKPVVFWAACSLPPRFFQSDPIVSFFTFFVDKEVQYKSGS